MCIDTLCIGHLCSLEHCAHALLTVYRWSRSGSFSKMADELADGDQQRLADIVKGLHGRLRKQLREGTCCIMHLLDSTGMHCGTIVYATTCYKRHFSGVYVQLCCVSILFLVQFLFSFVFVKGNV